MASCNWQKIKGSGDAKAMFRHCDSDMRIRHSHSNTQICAEKTHNNLLFGAFNAPNSYTSMCNAYDETLKQLDSKPGANKRKDRVTCVGINIPCPNNMSRDDAVSWFKGVYERMRGSMQGVLGAAVHFDEIHTYRDAETGLERTSRPHMHVYAIPIVNGKLNAKKYTSKANIIKLNNKVEAYTKEFYPHHRFLTGTKRKSTKSVEELKNTSQVKQAIHEKLVEEQQALRKRLNETINELYYRYSKVIENLDEAQSNKLLNEFIDAHGLRYELEAYRKAKVADQVAQSDLLGDFDSEPEPDWNPDLAL